jgi:phage terminase large subunit-like protein
MEEIRRLHNYKPTPFKAEGYVYKERFADAAVAFVQQLKHFKGRWKGMPFELIDWQEQIIRDLFGIVSRKEETRQFRRAYVEIPKKNGKSELAGAIALLLLVCDFEYGGEVYGCAVDRNQAGIVFDVAVRMMEQNPWLKKHITYSRSQHRMTFNPLGSFYQVLSADSGNKDGLNSHGVIFDELHAQRDRDFFDVMTTGG